MSTGPPAPPSCRALLTVELYRSVKANDNKWLHDHGLSGCWLTDKEERMRKAAAHFALQRTADANDEDALDAQGKMARAAKAIEEARSDAANHLSETLSLTQLTY